MIAAIAVWRVLACPIAVPEGMRATDSRTTEGGRDKRRGTDARYVVVVVGHFARCGHGHSAAPPLKPLFLCGIHRAARFQAGALS